MHFNVAYSHFLKDYHANDKFSYSLLSQSLWKRNVKIMKLERCLFLFTFLKDFIRENQFIFSCCANCVTCKKVLQMTVKLHRSLLNSVGKYNLVKILVKIKTVSTERTLFSKLFKNFALYAFDNSFSFLFSHSSQNTLIRTYVLAILFFLYIRKLFS